ncbi:hypothetical protein AY600_08765 [Phormidium willei BDU 130791]|nr:hypothetical protein AY600_08765 [Phormidium willei BDU 130791]
MLVVDPLHPSTLETLRQRFDVQLHISPPPLELAEMLQSCDAVVLRSGVVLDGEILRAAPNLKVIARAGVGVDNIDLDAAREIGCVVFNVPSQSAVSVAEFAIGLLLSAVRRITEADRQMRRGMWLKSALVGRELTGRRLGLVGVGEIGRRVGKLARAFGMQVEGCIARPTVDRREALREEGIGLRPLPSLLRRCDAISLHLPLTAATQNLISAQEIALMRQGAYLVNVSRGGIVDENALADALEAGHLAGAALDVHAFEGKASRLTTIETAVLTPHIGAMTEEAQSRIGESLVDGLDAVVLGHRLANRVD